MGECSNGVGITSFRTFHPLPEALLWVSLRDGSCAKDEATVVYWSAQGKECQKCRDQEGHNGERKASLGVHKFRDIATSKSGSGKIHNSGEFPQRRS